MNIVSIWSVLHEIQPLATRFKFFVKNCFWQKQFKKNHLLVLLEIYRNTVLLFVFVDYYYQRHKQ